MKKIATLMVVFLMLINVNVDYAAADIYQEGKPSTWATNDILDLSTYDVLDQKMFRDYQDKITRLEFIYLAVRLYESLTDTEIKPSTSVKFSDTTDVYALKGATVGITTGIGNGKFGPTALLSREQLATMFVKTLELAGVSMTKSTYKFVDDAQISSYAKEPIYKAYHYEIIKGYNNAVNPKGNATIEQALIVFKNTYDQFNTSVAKEILTSEQIGAFSDSVVKIYVDTTDGESVTGSGFIYEPGKIGTNYHVVENAKSITIEFEDGTFYEGAVKVLGFDKVLDLAAIAITRKTDPVLVLGTSSTLKKGQEIYTIGSPVGLKNTLSNGLISSLREDSIQITAPISPGSSGGVLLNVYGQVIGITNAGIIEGENLGFAIPVDLFKKLNKTNDYALDKFVALSSQKPKAVSYVNLKQSGVDALEVIWNDVAADYYVVYESLNGSEWTQILDNEGYVDFYYATPYCMTITGYTPGDVVQIAVAAVVDDVESDYVYSKTFSIVANTSTQMGAETLLSNTFSTLNLNGAVIEMDSYAITDFESSEIFVFGYVNPFDFLTYLETEDQNLTKVALESRAYAEQMKKMLGKEVSFILIYTDVYDTYEKLLDNNNIYSASITYNATTKMWDVYFPLMYVDTFTNTYANWHSDFSY